MAKIYVYCPRKSMGAMELFHALGATRLRRFDGLDFWNKLGRVRIEKGSTMICWGGFAAELDDVLVVNASKPITKYRELNKLISRGVDTVVPVSMDYIEQYPNVGYRYLRRNNNHIGGNDLLNPPRNPDFGTIWQKFNLEVRIHSFDGSSIRAGQKVVRDGFRLVEREEEWRPNANLAHPWIRSFDGGWRVNYDGFKSNAKMRSAAHQAVKALDLTFGAVDIGITPNNECKILEVNRAPGIEGGSIDAYVRAVNKYIEKIKSGGGDEDRAAREGDGAPAGAQAPINEWFAPPNVVPQEAFVRDIYDEYFDEPDDLDDPYDE